MKRRILSYTLIVLLTLVLAEAVHPLAALTSLAQGGCQTFNETGKTVCGKFLIYWQQHGGLAQQGFPISNSFQEKSDLDGKIYTVQYFERSVFEAHPEEKPPYDVLLSQLGTFRFKAKYPNGEPGTGGQPQPTVPPVSSIGQVINIPDEHFRVTVTNATEAQTVGTGADEAKAQGKYVLVFMTVDNLGTDSATLPGYRLKLHDGKGRNFDEAQDFAAQTGAASQNNLDYWFGTIQPSATLKTVIVYDVPVDVTGYTLLLK